jgi:general secretion pathway protein G
MGRSESIARAVVILVVALVGVSSSGAAETTEPGLELRHHLPRDPVLVFAMTSEDLSRSLDGFFETVEQFSGEDSSAELRAALGEWEKRMGFSLRDDLLAQVGPEFAVVIDLPSPEEMMNAVGNPTPENWAGLFRGVGKITRVRDPARLDDTLRKIFTAWEARLEEAEGLTRVTLIPGDAEGETGAALPEIPLYYGFGGDMFALGFSPDWVRGSLEARPVGERLEDGDDFSRIATHLDPQFTGLFYLNLPKIADWIRQSPLISMLIAGNEDAKRVAGIFLTDDYVGMGLGSTTIETDGGLRTTSFGPPGLSAGRLIRGVVAAIAIPDLLSALERGKQKRTMADLRSIGSVCDAYVIDHARFPGPTEGWAPVEVIAEQVQPVYIRQLPREDGWGNAYQYWSDGTRYRVVSTGKDGRIDQDWSGAIDPHETTDPAQDIIFGSGEFLAWPEGLKEEPVLTP